MEPTEEDTDLVVLTDDHIDLLDTFYDEPRSNADIGDDAETWAMIDDLVEAGYLDDGGDDGEEVAITQAGIDLIDAEDDDDGEEETGPMVYRSYFHDGPDEDIEEWADLDGALSACNDYIKNGAEPGDAAVELIESGEVIDVYDFLDLYVES